MLYKKETYDIVGAAMEVHRILGTGFLESVYQEVLECEMRLKKIPFEAQKKIEIFYKNQPLDKYFVADILCYEDIIVEL